MHPIMILMNAALGASGRRWVSGVLTAAVVLAVPAVAVALLLPGSFAATSTPDDLSLAGAVSAPNSNRVDASVPNGSTDETSEVRLKEWSYTKKPITPAVVTKK